MYIISMLYFRVYRLLWWSISHITTDGKLCCTCIKFYKKGRLSWTPRLYFRGVFPSLSDRSEKLRLKQTMILNTAGSLFTRTYRYVYVTCIWILKIVVFIHLNDAQAKNLQFLELIITSPRVHILNFVKKRVWYIHNFQCLCLWLHYQSVL